MGIPGPPALKLSVGPSRWAGHPNRRPPAPLESPRAPTSLSLSLSLPLSLSLSLRGRTCILWPEGWGEEGAKFLQSPKGENGVQELVSTSSPRAMMVGKDGFLLQEAASNSSHGAMKPFECCHFSP